MFIVGVLGSYVFLLLLLSLLAICGLSLCGVCVRFAFFPLLPFVVVSQCVMLLVGFVFLVCLVVLLLLLLLFVADLNGDGAGAAVAGDDTIVHSNV